MIEAAITVNDWERALGSQLDYDGGSWGEVKGIAGPLLIGIGPAGFDRSIGYEWLSKNPPDPDAVNASRNARRDLCIGINIDDDRCFTRISI